MSMSIFMLIPRKLQSKFYKTKKACGKHAIWQRDVAEINSMRISLKRFIDCLGRFWLRGRLWQVALHTKCP